MRWIIYARKSDDDTRVTEKSIADQTKEVRLVAEREGLEVADVFEESKSAKIPYKRPLFDQMLKRVESGEVGGVLCWHVNRLARNMAEGGMLAHLMAEGMLKEIKTPSSVYRTGDNIIPLVVEAGTSTQFSLEVSRNVSRGMKGHFERGGTTYKAPAGYRNHRDPDNLKRGIVIKDEERFALIRRAFEHFLGGGYTAVQIQSLLNNQWGFRSRGGKPLSGAGIHRLLRDPFYAGYVRYKGDLAVGGHEPMLTPAEFASVQRILEARATLRGPRRNKGSKKVAEPRFTFSGILRCGYCGKQITVDQHTMRSGQPYVSYHCSDSKGTCTKRGMSEQALIDALAQELSRIELDEALVRLAINNLRRELKKQYEQSCKDQSRMNAEVERLNHRLFKLRDMYLDNLFESESEYRDHVEVVRREKAQAQQRLIGSDLSFEEASESAENAGRFILQARTAFLNGETTKKREIVNALATGYRLYGHEKRIEIDLDPRLEALVRYASLLQVTGSVVRVAPAGRNEVIEPGKIGSGTKKKAPAREAFFSGGPGETIVEPNIDSLNTDILEIIRIFTSHNFPFLDI